MKKRILISIAAMVLALLMMILLLPSGTDPSNITSTPASSASAALQTTTTVRPVAPTTSVVFTPTGTTIVTSPVTLPSTPPVTTQPLPEAPGVVRLYTCDSEKLEIYRNWAETYYAQTGTEVLILTPPEGTDCAQALTQLLQSDTPPTVFCIHSEQMLLCVEENLLDLTGSDALSQLYSGAFAYTSGGKALALAMDVSGNGLICNADLLAAPVGFTDSDIHSFADLEYIFSYITENRSRLGVYALAAPDYMDTHLMQTLAGLFAEGDQLRSFVDLYTANTTSRTTTLNYFLKGTTIFYIGGTEDYDTVRSLGSNKLRFLPAYAQGSAAVQCVCDYYWAVNGAVSNADTRATLDFLSWLVTADGAAAPVDDLELLSPYQDATYYANTLQKQLRSYLSQGQAYVTWQLSGTVTDTAAFAAALKAYVAAPTDETWSAVAALMESA